MIIWKKRLGQDYVTPAALEFILPSLTEITSRRRLAATAAGEEPRLVGAVESD